MPVSEDCAPDVDPELLDFLAGHPAPAACADALLRDDRGRILLVDPTYKDGWDLPGGMLEDEEPAPALVRELSEELGLDAEVGRLLAVDTLPATLYGRTVLAFLYAAHLPDRIDTDALVLQDSEIRAADFFPEDVALELLPPGLRRRLAAALEAERGSHTAVLRDGHRPPARRRDHHALLPAPMTTVTVLVTDTAGRILVLEPVRGAHLGLPGDRVRADESPVEAAARALEEGAALCVPAGRLLAVDTSPAAAAGHGRARTCLVFSASPLTPEEASHTVFPGGEILAVHWMDRHRAEQELPARLAARVKAGLDALASGGTVHLERGEPVTVLAEPTVRERATRARAEMVERLEVDGGLTDPALRRALLAVRREVLIPHCYISRPTAAGQPKAWQLLDGADPRDRTEWLAWIHDGESVLVQHRGEAFEGLRRGRIVLGGGFTAMSTGMTTAVEVLQALRPVPGDRVLELGTGPGLVTAALCEILGDGAVTTVEADPHMARAAGDGLARLGHRPRLVCGDGLGGIPGEQFEKILLSFAVRALPPALTDLLADGGTLLAPVTAAAAGWPPARAEVHRTGDTPDAVLRPVASGHRAGRGADVVIAPDLTPDGPLTSRRCGFVPTGKAGFWLAVGHLLPGLVRAESAGLLTLYAPGENSAVLVRSEGGAWMAEHTGPRNIWSEVEEVHDRWVRAGSPDHYRIDVTDPAVQRVTGGTQTRHPLQWLLPVQPPATQVSTASGSLTADEGAFL